MSHNHITYMYTRISDATRWYTNHTN